MRIDLAGWSSRGFRCPDIDIDLQHNVTSSVSLIQMPNGTGKTTTLNLLMAALDGTAVHWDSTRVTSFRRPGDDQQKGQFLAKLLVDGRPLTFELTLDFEDGEARYRTSAPGSGGVVRGWKPPPSVHRFLSPHFLNLFVFDGEFAERLLDPRQSEAERAIDALCQLYLLDDIAAVAENEWSSATRNRSATTPVGLTRWENVRDQIERRLSTIEKAKEEAEGELAALSEEIGQLEQRIAQHARRTEATKQEHSEAEDDARKASAAMENAANEVMRYLRLPQAIHAEFATALLALKDNLDRLKLPESTTAQFFDELLEEPTCICGRPIDEDARQHIMEHKGQYLGEEEAGVINEMKKDITLLQTDTKEEPVTDTLRHATTELETSVRALSQAEQRRRTLYQRLIDEGDQELSTWQTKLQEKSFRYDQLQQLLLRINSTTDEEDDIDEMFSLQQLQARKKDAVKKISEITGTLKLREQTSLIQDIVQTAQVRARSRIRSNLLDECNERLRTVLSHDPLQLDRIDHSLHLVRQTGASVGQTLSVGYTFLMSVLNRGQNHFPLIVDSPANPLDTARRREIGRLIPQLCSQFVGFTISTERIGFVSALEESVAEQGGEIQYFTLFRKTAGTESLIREIPQAALQTDNAVLVNTRDYFYQFDIEEELN